MRSALRRSLLAVTALVVSGENVNAATTTDPFDVSITIVATCDIMTTNPLNFGAAVGLLTANIDASTTFAVRCTTSTPYDIALNAGNNAATPNDTTTRRMEDGGEFVSYNLYQDNARTVQWGTFLEGDEQTGIPGTGSDQTYTVYGRVAPQTTPSPGTYDDVIQITVQY